VKVTWSALNTGAARTALLALGFALGGWFVGHGFAGARAADRYVTVKGVAEREATADLALWPLRLVAGDNDLGSAQARIAFGVRSVRAFLARNGVDTSQVETQGYQVTDAYANQYRSADEVSSRYVIQQTVMVRSDRPEVVAAAAQKVDELVRAGVVISSGGDYGSGPTFLFTRLNSLKPQMIAEATARAREGAEQFARDSRASLGGIRRATQGVFEILPRDQAPGVDEGSQIAKTIRVVSTVEYFLRD